MIDYTHYLNLTLGIFTIIFQVICVFVLISLFVVSDRNKFQNKILSFISDNFLVIGFLFSFFATGFSLFYSDVLNFAPCFLCWLQRIFIFPQVILFGMAYIKKDKNVAHYAFPLLFIGSLIALYHNFLYYFGESIAPCDASGLSCVKRLVYEIGGYISIPMFSLTMFLILITTLLVAHFYKNENI